MKKGLFSKIIIGLLVVVLAGSTYFLVTTYSNYQKLKDELSAENNSNEIENDDNTENDENEEDIINNIDEENANNIENDNANNDNEITDEDIEDVDTNTQNDTNIENDENNINDTDNEDNLNNSSEDNDTIIDPEPKDPVVVEAKSIYLRDSYPASESVIEEVIELAKTTELNSVVIDIKEGGRINYATSVKEAYENDLYTTAYDPEYVVKKLQDNGIYVIGRIVCFKDDAYAKLYPDRAIKTPQGTILSSDKSAWANPYIEENWHYNIEIALEAIQYGFDEIQFDYVRFPSASKNSVDYGDVDLVEYSRAKAIADFLEIAYQKIKIENGVNLSADVFAIACISDLDARIIGQRVDWISKHVDYICPMIYPSHYANDSNGIMGNGVGQGINGTLFTKPDLHPYEVVYATLMAMTRRLEGKEDIIAKIRPYIQDFTATYLRDGYYQTYGEDEVRAQIEAIYDAGYSEWILWDGGGNRYTREAFIVTE